MSAAKCMGPVLETVERGLLFERRGQFQQVEIGDVTNAAGCRFALLVGNRVQQRLFLRTAGNQHAAKLRQLADQLGISVGRPVIGAGFVAGVHAEERARSAIV